MVRGSSAWRHSTQRQRLRRTVWSNGLRRMPVLPRSGSAMNGRVVFSTFPKNRNAGLRHGPFSEPITPAPCRRPALLSAAVQGPNARRIAEGALHELALVWSPAFMRLPRSSDRLKPGLQAVGGSWSPCMRRSERGFP